MEKVKFYSYKPYLHIPLHKTREISVDFSGDCTYTAKSNIELQLLREYAESTRASYLITEAGGEVGMDELIRLHEQWEGKLLTDLEQRQAEKAKEEEKQKEWHDIYSLLRGSDKVYR